MGTYLTTIHHNKGVVLWGGASWERIMRFEISKKKELKPEAEKSTSEDADYVEIRGIQFSPCEKYLITLFCGKKQSLIFWDVRTGKLLREFDNLGEIHTQWPIFKWSHDDKYAARMAGGQNIYIYEMPSVRLLEKKPLSFNGLKDFNWSPSENLLAYVLVPNSNDIPSSFRVIEIPSKKEKVTKNFFKVKDVIIITKFFFSIFF